MTTQDRPASELQGRLRAEIGGAVLFDRFSRGRYATDASAYQQMPTGVVVPRTMDEAERALAIAISEGVPVTPRGGGTSQCGQTINTGLIVDCSRHLNRITDLDVAGRQCAVEPGIVLDELNRQLRPHGLWFPVDVSTASRCTIGGMAGNNSCGGRSLRYGTTRDNVISIEAVMADGSKRKFGRGTPEGWTDTERLFALGAREAAEIEARFPKVQRRVGGYNLDALVPGAEHNLAHLLIGSEGTLAFSTRIELKLSPLMGRRAVGACHFGSFYEAMDAAQHLVTLGPIAVELVDSTLLTLARDIAMFRPTLEQFVEGDPAAILLVEFAEDDDENRNRIKALKEMMGDLGFGWDKKGAKWGGVVEVFDPALQAAIADVRTSGLNIMMSMKDQGKPVSFVEDCAVPLEHLADYTERLTGIFEKNGTRGTWYAHASVGCLHVRPLLNLRLDLDVKKMRAIAEEAFEMVRAYKGSHSGEHGDGIARSEFHETMFGERLVRAFEEVKDIFDPTGMMNPGKIVRAPKFDDKNLFRYNPNYTPVDFATELDWSAFPGVSGGFQGAVEMCNNNGACRKLAGGTMCPSYRVTKDEKHVTRGRANVLRLAISGQLGPDAFASEEMAEALKLCVSCKGCRRECPTGVDMARFKIEVLAARGKKYGHSLRDYLVGWLPYYAPLAAKMPALVNLRDRIPGLARLLEPVIGFSAQRTLPKWRRDIFRDDVYSHGPADGRPVVLFADTFNRYFERENIDAALAVLVAGGYRVYLPYPLGGSRRPLCCGRTFLSVGRVDKARAEAQRVIDALKLFIANDVPVVGLEPSCIYSFRDEIPAMLKTEEARKLATLAMPLEDFLAREAAEGHLDLALGPVARKIVLHGHCHQKSFGGMGSVEKVLRMVPDIEIEMVESSCCGMAGSFGYAAETIDVSRAMGELSLLPAVRKAPEDAVIVADGTSCRHQIEDGAARRAVHVARILEQGVVNARSGADMPLREAAE